MDATLKEWIASLRNHLTSAYNAIAARRGTVPDDKNASNLTDAILSIPAGLEVTVYDNETIELHGCGTYDDETIELPEYK